MTKPISMCAAEEISRASVQHPCQKDVTDKGNVKVPNSNNHWQDSGSFCE